MSSYNAETELELGAIPAEATATKAATSAEESVPTKDFGLIPIPKRLQYNPVKPYHFGILLNVFFGFASTCSTCSR